MDEKCLMCEGEIHDEWHFFLECPPAVVVWNDSGIGNMVQARMREDTSFNDCFLVC